MARNGGKFLIPSDEASAEGTVERRWAGGPVDLVGGGRESSPISMVNCGSGLAGPSSGPSCGPSALSCGEAQDFGLVSRVALSRDPRPSPLSLREGVSGEACGPVQAGDLEDGAFYGNETPISLPRARFLQSPPISKGASQDARGEADPLVGLPRDSMTRVSSQMMNRGLLTDEALCEEASRYVDLCFIPMGGSRSLFSFSFFFRTSDVE